MKKHVISLLAILLVLIFTLTSCGDSEYIAELESQIEDLNQEILDKNEENERLKEELSAKDGELNTLKSNIKQIEDEILALEARIEELLNDKDYIVTFDLNGGEGSVEDQTVRYKNTVDEPTAPTKAHYDFLGWYVGGVKVEFPYLVTSNTEFVAEYAPTKYTVSYVVNDGTMPESYITEYDVETPVTLPIPTRDLYLFDGWYEDAKFEGEKVREIKAGEFGNRTFYAKWLSTTNGIIYQLSNDGAYYTVTGYDGSDTVIVIPDSVGGIPVTEIAKDAFKGKQRITSITVPDSVTSIGDYAFYNCSSLVSVTIPDSVEFIGYCAFEYCYSLYVVYNNSDLFLEIGSSNNGYLAYYAKILVDNGETIYRDDGYNYTLTDDGFLYREKDSKYELISYIGGEDTVTLPENINGNSYDLYSMRGVVNVIIPESFTTINDEAFYDCSSLESVVIGDSVTSIGFDAFAYCKSLVSVTIPDSVTSIGDYAFEYCPSLESVVIGDSVTSIGDWAFCECSSLESVVIGDSVEFIGSHAFVSCPSLVSVTIPDSVTSIGGYAFNGCFNLTSIIVDENNKYYKSIDGNLYSKDGKTLIQYAIGKEDTSFEIPYGVTSIGSGAFASCSSLVSVTIPDSVTSIGEWAFRSCSSLVSVVIGDSVTSIDGYAFYYCSSLTEVYYNGSAAEWNSIYINSNGNAPLQNATRYYYSENQPTEEGNFWHWVDGEVKIWE